MVDMQNENDLLGMGGEKMDQLIVDALRDADRESGYENASGAGGGCGRENARRDARESLERERGSPPLKIIS